MGFATPRCGPDKMLSFAVSTKPTDGLIVLSLTLFVSCQHWEEKTTVLSDLNVTD